MRAVYVNGRGTTMYEDDVIEHMMWTVMKLGLAGTEWWLMYPMAYDDE